MLVDEKYQKAKTYSEQDVGMRFTANISNVWAQTSKFWDFIPFDIAEYEWEWVGLCEMRRVHCLSITGIYARIGLGLRLSQACNNKSD